MLATFFSVIAAVALLAGVQFLPNLVSSLTLPITVFQIFFLFSLFLSILPWGWAIFFTSRSEKTPISAYALRSVLADRRLYLFSSAILLCSLAGFLLLSQTILPRYQSVAIAFLLAGYIIDNLRWSFFRIQYRRGASGLAEWILTSMQRATRRHKPERITEYLEGIFSLLVSYMKTHDIGSLRLFTQKITDAAGIFLRSIAKLSLFKLSAASQETLLDQYNVAEAMVAKRLTWVVSTALETKAPTNFEESVRLYAKLFLAFHNQHSSLGHILLLSLSETAHKAEEIGWDKDLEVTSTLSEVVKTLIDTSLERRISDHDSIKKVLILLEMHVKESFRRDRRISPALLMQPFAEIGQLLAGEQYAALPERDLILSDLKRILSQFAALEGVTSRISSSEEGTDTSASYHEDIPYMPREPQEGGE